MRISDLSREAGVPVHTIKFYLRQGLLPPGERTSRNQAIYGTPHVHRLRLIRALTTIGRLDLASVQILLAAMSDQSLPLPGLFDVMNRVIDPLEEDAAEDDEVLAEVRRDVNDFISARGWNVALDAPARHRFEVICTTLRQLGCEHPMDYFTAYAEAAELLSRMELDLLNPGAADRGATVARDVLFDGAFSALRRMAQEHQLVSYHDPGKGAAYDPGNGTTGWG
ncbi:MerR family transcriptional regulator [Actinoplanes cyaneus]|uniref:MerR family transcriptional regulator n=1 Tax=Actinoplanes cyaneus TaxID=52696 RepID=A0A919IKT1_9ACTN|nr:MerR family transcriptional regulator [Actinoplanes cyaneus]MCW2138224.1 DNA-binding transcriptional regulator, MerR family [Actinoplanes cyaneus]GID66182.1 MerR family transcriptional regulator [Actinoplanes cyaneus]